MCVSVSMHLCAVMKMWGPEDNTQFIFPPCVPWSKVIRPRGKHIYLASHLSSPRLMNTDKCTYSGNRHHSYNDPRKAPSCSFTDAQITDLFFCHYEVHLPFLKLQVNGIRLICTPLSSFLKAVYF